MAEIDARIELNRRLVTRERNGFVLRERRGGTLIAIARVFALILLALAGPIPAGAVGESAPQGARLALLISAPVPRPGGSTGERSYQPIAAQLARVGFATTTVEQADETRMREAIRSFTAKVGKGSTAMLLFQGAMLRVRQTTLLMPVDAKGASENHAREAGIDLNAFESELSRRGAAVKIFIIDAARSNVIAERFGLTSDGPAGLELHGGTLAIINAWPVRGTSVGATEMRGQDDLFLDELLRQTAVPDITLETAFARTRLAVAAASGRRQVPSVSSSLSNDFYIARDVRPVVVPLAAADGAESSSLPSARAAADRGMDTGGESAASAGSGAPNPGEIFRDCETCPDLVVVPPGEFMMGSADNESEKPAHRVVIAKPFAIGRHEITFAQWDACVAANACKADIDDHGYGRAERPVIDVSWDEAQAYVKWLSRQTGQTYRLPSEAEWEYAARAGSRTSFPWGAAAGSGRANCKDCSADAIGGSLPVGSFRPNAFGLFDMAGNAAEFVEDCWNASYRSAPADGSAWTKGQCQLRVLRGGAFTSKSDTVRSAARFRYDHDVRYYANGFRVARNIP